MLAQADERLASTGKGSIHVKASTYAAYLQSPEGRWQIAALEPESVLNLPKNILLMGESAFGQQLYVRPCYVKLRTKLTELAILTRTGVRDVIVSGTPGIGKSFCSLFLASLFISQARRVIYEWHGKDSSTTPVWYHFWPADSQPCYHTDSFRDISPYIVNDPETMYIVDGGLPRALSRGCWCYTFTSPRKEMSRWSRKSPGVRVLCLPVWTLLELQQCRQLIAEFNQNLTEQSVEIAYQLAGGIPRTVLNLVARREQGSTHVDQLIISNMQHAVTSLHVQVGCAVICLDTHCTAQQYVHECMFMNPAEGMHATAALQ